MENKFKVNISFIDNKTETFDKVNAYLNLNDEDDWIMLDSNMIGSYELILIKLVIEEKRTKKEIYVFAKNANLILKNNILDIETFSQRNLFIKIKPKQNLKKQIADLKNKFDYLNAKQFIGLDVNEFLSYKQLKYDLYILKLRDLFNLKEANNV
ncbi:MSC_0621 family F1-like ATPase epsilon subunit [Metamycoplasma salivarium]|uniref:MSC_0621 family F1-like ATPase epsilon subunit n=1 Tax=Metamycoplasma salivarium TaxID=2124 RepID=UPI0035BC6248